MSSYAYNVIDSLLKLDAVVKSYRINQRGSMCKVYNCETVLSPLSRS